MLKEAGRRVSRWPIGREQLMGRNSPPRVGLSGNGSRAMDCYLTQTFLAESHLLTVSVADIQVIGVMKSAQEILQESGDNETQDLKNFAVKDADAALQFVYNADYGEQTEIEEKGFVRRLDWMLMPLMFMCYYLQYTDKTLLSYAAVMGVIEDTHMPANGFSNLAIAFYVSFLFFEPIQSFMIQKFPAAKFLGCNVILWGIVITLNCVCNNFASVVALRVLLGVFESATAPR